VWPRKIQASAVLTWPSVGRLFDAWPECPRGTRSLFFSFAKMTEMTLYEKTQKREGKKEERNRKRKRSALQRQRGTARNRFAARGQDALSSPCVFLCAGGSPISCVFSPLFGEGFLLFCSDVVFFEASRHHREESKNPRHLRRQDALSCRFAPLTSRRRARPLPGLCGIVGQRA
jgi:hypothetical protein